MSAKAAGISYEQLCLWLLAQARTDGKVPDISGQTQG